MKERITITLDSELIRQIDKRIDGDIIKNRSQQIELLLTKALGTYRPEKAVILAGGKRKQQLFPCLLEVQGKTIAEHTFDLLKKYGIREIVMSIGSKEGDVKDYYGDGSKFGVSIVYVEEDKPLGTAGPLKLAKKHLNDSFIVTNGDDLKNINIPRMFRLHKRKDALATIALTTVADPSHYGVARLSGSRVLEFMEKPKADAPSNLISAGFYILEPEVIEMIPDGYSTLEKDIFPKLAAQGRLRGFPFAGQWFDANNPESYESAKKKWLGVSVYDESG
ncbi:hypothetical protein KY347_00470 [Candidatus Woesearchaeota archaeon]|nr:hypothetical protein [Candidatus Woesearchaeota archaeon]